MLMFGANSYTMITGCKRTASLYSFHSVSQGGVERMVVHLPAYTIHVHTQTHTHTHVSTHSKHDSLSLSLSHTHTQTQTHTCTDARMHAHTHTHRYVYTGNMTVSPHLWTRYKGLSLLYGGKCCQQLRKETVSLSQITRKCQLFVECQVTFMTVYSRPPH